MARIRAKLAAVPTNDPVRRPSPDALLRAAQRAERGRLKIFLGGAPGVGKTYAMLQQGAERLAAGVDVAVGMVETHGRRDTEALVAPLEVIARRVAEHRGHALGEMDLDALLARAPALALVDELAHSNAAGSRHAKRWQDVADLLDAGIDVLTTLNIQHVESLNDVVAGFTHVRVRETVPDHVLEGAEIEVVDLPPDELIERLKAGKVYVPEEASRALGNFFSHENLSALREMALRRAAQSVDRRLVEHLDGLAVPGTFAGGERVLVAISELPGSEALVRAGKRLADALHAPWQAVHIETPRSTGFSEAERRIVAGALRLAASLGATIATVPAETVIQGLRAQLQTVRATQLVIGKSQRSWWFELRHRSVVEALLRESDGLAVHVLPGEAAPLPRRRLPRFGSWTGLAAAAVLVALATVFATLVEPWIGGGAIDLLYLLPVILTAVRFGRWPGITAGILAGLAYNFFFLPPVHTFTIADPRSVLTVLVLLGTAVFVAEMAQRLKVRATVGARSAQENAAVAAFGQALARASDWRSTSETVCRELSQALDVSVLVLGERDGRLSQLAARPPDVLPLGPVDAAAADRAWSKGEVTGRDTGTLGSADWQFHPLVTTLGVLAVVALVRADGAPPIEAGRATLLSTLLGQAALAHERLRLEDQLRDVTVLEERDRLRAALLSSIGHDLRTPLTAVAGALDSIAGANPSDVNVPLARAALVRLQRFLHNLLEMVRLDTGALSLSFEAVDLTDAVSSALGDVRDLMRDVHVDLHVAADLPMVRADPRLLHHILWNLLSNAVSHGGSRIVINGRRCDGGVELSIADDGPGLPGDPAAIFASFVRGAGSDRTGGSGLGLAIAKGFSDAMNLRISAANDPGGGAIFCLVMPLAGTVGELT